MSRRGKAILGAVVLIIAAMPSLLLYSAWKRKQAGDRFIIGALAHYPATAIGRFTHIERTVQPMGVNAFDVHFTAEGKLSQPLYDPIDPVEFLRSLPEADLAAMAKLWQATRPKPKWRLLELAGVTTSPSPLDRASILQVATSAGAPLKYQGVLASRLRGQDWTYQITSGDFLAPAPVGRVRSAFSADAYDLSQPNSKAALKAEVRRQTEMGRRLAAAEVRYQAELAQLRERRRAAFLSALQAGTLFAGIGALAHPGTANSVRLFLEIVSASPDEQRFSAVLRNDGSWADARHFTGTWQFDDDVTECQIVLRTDANDALANAGPFLDVAQSWSIDAKLGGDFTLTGSSAGVRFEFHRLETPDAEKLKAEVSEPLNRALAATIAGAVYRGSILFKPRQTSEAVLLRFTRQAANGGELGAEFELFDRPDMVRQLDGSIAGNRYQARENVIQLRSARFVEAADGTSALGFRGTLAFGLRLDGNSLSGDDQFFAYRLIRLSEADISQIEEQRKAGRAAFNAVVDAGGRFDGTARFAPTGFVGRLQLIVTSVDRGQNALGLAIASLDQADVVRRFQGSFDPASQILRVATVGQVPVPAIQALGVPFFTSNSGFAVVLRVTGDRIDGTLLNRADWQFQFGGKNRKADSASIIDRDGLVVFPRTAGAYVLLDSQWVSLPRNNARANRDAALVARDIGGVLAKFIPIAGQIASNVQQPVSGRSGELVFSGVDPRPVAPQAHAVIAYVGAINRVNSGISGIEIAPTQMREDGSRAVDLMPAGQNTFGFQNRGIAMAVTQPAIGVVLCTTNAELGPGTYALGTGEQFFEFEVR